MRFNRGFTLLEVILSITILSVIVYSVFVVFDKTMTVLNRIFVGAHRYEQVKTFFDRISFELTSSLVDTGEGSLSEIYHFVGGPHWIEFGTPEIKKVTIEEYIEKGVNELISEPKKVMYFAARTQKQIVGPGGFTGNYGEFFQTPVYRLVPVDGLHKNLLVGLNDTDPMTINKNPDNNPVVPQWLEQRRFQKEAQKTDFLQSTGLDEHYESIHEVARGRSAKFRYYYYTVVDWRALYTEMYSDPDLYPGMLEWINSYSYFDEPQRYRYIQDWWDSRLRYPTFLSNDIGDEDLNKETVDTYYNISDYMDRTDIPNVPDIMAERYRRFGPVSDSSALGFTFSELWQYEDEVQYEFKVFEDSTEPIEKSIGLSGLGYYSGSYLNIAAIDNDPWFNRPPAMVEITFYLYDPEKDTVINDVELGEDIFKDKWKLTEGNTSASPEALKDALKDAYRGETFTLRVFMRNSSSVVSKYNRNLVQE